MIPIILPGFNLEWSEVVDLHQTEGRTVGSLCVFVSTDRFKADPQYENTITLTVAPKSDSTIELCALALKGLERIFCHGYKIRKAGVTLSALEFADSATMPLWDRSDYEKQRRLMIALDAINSKHGRDTVSCGLFQSEGVWRTRFGRRSPRYTTRWEEICKVPAG